MSKIEHNIKEIYDTIVCCLQLSELYCNNFIPPHISVIVYLYGLKNERCLALVIDNFFIIDLWVWVMVFNTTFLNISVISWRSVLLVEEETGVLVENYHTITTPLKWFVFIIY